MSRPDTFFTTLNGITVLYDRKPGDYGIRGVARDFFATRAIERKLDACFAELEDVCPLGRPTLILSAGAWVDKPGFHGSGEAFDLDAIHWTDKKFVCGEFLTDKRFYLGVDAVLRKHVPTVLNFFYNDAHHDHLHADLGGAMRFTRAESEVYFLQAALTHVLDIPVGIDGDWGPNTSAGTERALTELGISGSIEDEAVWMQLLTAISSRAFGEPIPVSGAKTVSVRKVTVGDKTTWFAIVDNEPEFTVGRETFFAPQTGRGLSSLTGLTYDPDDYREKYGFWADFIYPTAFCESQKGFFNALNTWDRAHFTFGFMQFGAHVFDGDFARYFRGLLALKEASAYFPKLELKDNFIHQKTAAGLVNLETNTDPTKLAKFLNPDFRAVEQVEVENAARFIHWCNKSLENRQLQVKVSVEVFKSLLSRRAVIYSLNGKPDKVCLVIADIHHQGRGKVAEVKSALDTGGDMNKAFRNLLEIGKVKFPGRIATLKSKISEMTAAGTLGIKKYDASSNDFVNI